MLKFLTKLALFFLIPLAILTTFVALTPVNMYTYRSWEALSTYSIDFGRPFYPNQHLEIVEVGELGVRTDYEIERPVEFITDAYGQRYAGPNLDAYDIIVVGDSHVVGSGLSQADTIGVILADKTGLNVYPFYRSIDGFLHTAYLTSSKPKIVLLMIIERRLAPDLCPDSLPTSWPFDTDPWQPAGNFKMHILIDRIIREGYYSTQFLRAKRTEPDVIANKSTGMLFFEPSILSPESSPDFDKENTLDGIIRCSQWFEDQSVQFYFVPVPDKENAYFDNIPDLKRPELDTPRDQLLKDIYSDLNGNGVAVIDLLTPFLSAKQEGTIPYQLDDSHLSPAGIRIAVEEITAEINCQESNCELKE